MIVRLTILDHTARMHRLYRDNPAVHSMINKALRASGVTASEIIGKQHREEYVFDSCELVGAKVKPELFDELTPDCVSIEDAE